MNTSVYAGPHGSDLCADPVGYYKCCPLTSDLCAGEPPSYHHGVEACPRTGHAVCRRTSPARKRVRARCKSAGSIGPCAVQEV